MEIKARNFNISEEKMYVFSVKRSGNPSKMKNPPTYSKAQSNQLRLPCAFSKSVGNKQDNKPNRR